LRKTAISLSTLLLILSTFLAISAIPSPAHAQFTGTVCIDNATSTTCPSSPPTLTGVVGSNVTVSVNIQGSDTFNAFDISVATNASTLDPLSIDYSASLIHQPLFVATDSVNSTTGVARLAIAAEGYSISGPATGNLFRITYKVLSSSTAKIGYSTGCSSPSNDNLCVSVVNAGTVDPENVQIANFGGSAPPDFSITANPTSLTIRQGTSATSLLTLTSLNGFTGTVSLSATISPLVRHGPTATLSPTSVTLSSGGTGSSTLTVSTARNTPTGTYAVTVTGVSGSISHSVTVTVTVTSAK
jgi:hypothetical protein